MLCLLSILFILFSCSDDDDDNGCDIIDGLVDCAAPLSYTGISIYFLDRETNENSFVSSSLTIDDIVVTDDANNVVDKKIEEIEPHSSDLPFRSHFLVISDDFKSGENTFSFTVKNNIEFKITVDAIEYTAGCCPGIYMEDLEVNGVDHSLENSIYLPIIYVE